MEALLKERGGKVEKEGFVFVLLDELHAARRVVGGEMRLILMVHVWINDIIFEHQWKLGESLLSLFALGMVGPHVD